MWDLQQASAVRTKLAHIGDLSRRALAERFLDTFEIEARPRLADLRAQVIHNDLNPHNVLVAADGNHLAGIIDFGDMVHAPLIADLAIAAAYQLAPAEHPLSAIADLVAGYDAVLPLHAAELDILFDLIATRMVLTVDHFGVAGLPLSGQCRLYPAQLREGLGGTCALRHVEPRRSAGLPAGRMPGGASLMTMINAFDPARDAECAGA